MRRFKIAVLGSALILASLGLGGCRTHVDGPGYKLPEEHFDGRRAFDYVRYQVELGPRPPQSAPLLQLATDLRSRLEGYGYQVSFQEFTAETPQGPMKMRNVVATLPGKTSDTFVIGAHYDTKIFKEFAFVGANDGASGVAVSLELARLLAEYPLRHTVQFVFFDGEEAIENWSPEDSLYGSRHFVDELVRSGQSQRIKAAFVLDMVGDRELKVAEDSLSSPELNEALRETADELNLRSYFPSPRYTGVSDDHCPFLEHGIPAVDIIGIYFTYAEKYPDYWHTKNDTLDKIAPESLAAVGAVVLRTLRKLDSNALVIME